MPSFQFQARYVLLTYAQSDGLDPFQVSDHMSSLGGECIVAREDHSDGGSHLHAFVDFGKLFRSRRTDVFDVGGYHPNISPTKQTPSAGYDYACKDGDICAGGLARPPDRLPSRENQYDAIFDATTRDEFFERCREFAPRLLLGSFGSLCKYADWRYRVDPEPYRHDDSLRFDLEPFPELLGWADANIGVERGVSPFFFFQNIYASGLKPLPPGRAAPL